MGSLWLKRPGLEFQEPTRPALCYKVGYQSNIADIHPLLLLDGLITDRLMIRLARTFDHAAKPVRQGFILEVGEFPGIHEHAVIGADFIPDMRLVGI